MLPLLNAALLTDLVVIGLLLTTFSSKTLTQWYREFGIGAVLADVLVLVLVVWLAHFLYQGNLFVLASIAVAIQLIHDVLFGLFIQRYQGNSPILNVFKGYTKEHGFKILLADATMIVSTVLFEHLFSMFHYNEILSVFLVYLVPYFVFSV
jgi:F0F1-type ATP synthase assembly protein I